MSPWCTAADLLQHRRQQAVTDALRAGVLLHGYGDQSTYCFHHLHRQRQQVTIFTHLQQQQGHQQQTSAPCMAGSRLTASLSTSSQLIAPQACSSSCLLTCQHSKCCCLHWTGSCHQRPNKHAKLQSRASRSMNFRQLSSCLPVAISRAQKACPMSSSPSSGRCWAQSCRQSCKMPFKLGIASACQPQ